MQRSGGLLLALVTLAVIHTGCRSETCQIRTAAADPPSHELIFNPVWSAYPQADVARSLWPATDVNSSLSQDTVYSIHIIDTQDPWIDGRASYYRRAEAIQFGRTRR